MRRSLQPYAADLEACAGVAQDLIDELFQPQGPFVELSVGCGLILSRPEVFVSEVEGHENCQSKHVRRWCGVGCGAHLLIDIRGQLADVRRIETASDWVPLSADFNGDNTAHWKYVWSLVSSLFSLVLTEDQRPGTKDIKSPRDARAFRQRV